LVLDDCTASNNNDAAPDENNTTNSSKTGESTSILNPTRWVSSEAANLKFIDETPSKLGHAPLQAPDDPITSAESSNNNSSSVKSNAETPPEEAITSQDCETTAAQVSVSSVAGVGNAPTDKSVRMASGMDESIAAIPQASDNNAATVASSDVNNEKRKEKTEPVPDSLPNEVESKLPQQQQREESSDDYEDKLSRFQKKVGRKMQFLVTHLLPGFMETMASFVTDRREGTNRFVLFFLFLSLLFLSCG
jgi:hypothetical protein